MRAEPGVRSRRGIVALAADEAAGQLLAVGSSGRAVHRVAADGAPLGAFATQPSDPAALGLGAVDLAIGPGGEVALARQALYEIERYTPDGRLLGRIALTAEPTGVDYEPAGRLLVHAGAEVLRMSTSGQVESRTVVDVGGPVSSGDGSAAWLVTWSRLWRLSGGRPAALAGSTRRSGRAEPGSFVVLTDAVAVRPEGGAWAMDGRLQYFDRRGRARMSCTLDAGNRTPDRLTRLGRTLFVSDGASIRRLAMTRRAPGVCTRQALRIRSARLHAGGARLHVSVSQRARLALVVHREIDCAGAPPPCSELRAVKEPLGTRLRRGTSTVRVRGLRGLPSGRYRLQLAARAQGAWANYELLSFRR
jgi:hypothetical protein